MRQVGFYYYTQIAMLFVGFLLTANVLGPKPLAFGWVTIPAGLVIFPMTYLLGVILTEVYGFVLSRKVIWTALICNLFMALTCQLAIVLPYDPLWQGQEAYQNVLGTSSRLMAVSVFTYFIGEFVNSYVVAKLKVKLQGRLFCLRGLCGNWLGEGVETALFLPLAFYHLPANVLLKMSLFYYLFKITYAACAMPFVKKIVFWLKNKEQIDVYDDDTNFNPFSFLSINSTTQKGGQSNIMPIEPLNKY